MDDRAAGGTRPTISVVIPCFNEAESLPQLCGEISGALSGMTYEIVIIDDGSTDGSWEAILELSKRFPLRAVRFGANRGKAAALSEGFSRSRGLFVATVDADLQDDPLEIPAMIGQLEREGLGLVSGWKKRRQDPPTKTIPSRVFNWAVRLTTGLPLHDFNCGLKVYRGEVARQLDLYGEMHRYTPVLVAQQGHRVGEKAVNHRPRLHGKTKYGVSRFFRGFADLATVLFLHRYSFRPLHFFAGFGLFLSLVGFAISAYLTALWFSGEPIGSRPLLLLGVLLMIVGFQFVSLGLLAEMLLSYAPRRPIAIVEECDSTRSGEEAGSA
ncbi:glycosyltransferase family 2 protein [Candidatus Fermentibacterales bacterium]|nr:glycosyltransferase family 2 protein [Candidatus Fermentibacterales bacterium]